MDQSSLWKKPVYSQMVTSPLVPKVIPVAERVETIIQEFAPTLNELIVSSNLHRLRTSGRSSETAKAHRG
eukprot:TRINITY_DN6782_c0_g1_i1.p1 TRINITY_DN6782_c0_g1~~TRINITY_DN6782_c0_g1_i1.p1  ORF type:complete len:70 (+),score=16.79 TRINITY_DN6782_c0_g1_i1:49-258(+)